MENIRDHTTASDTPEIIIRLAGPEDAQALSRLRYEFRAGQYPVTEAEADFLSRCGAWMAACLAPGSHCNLYVEPWRRDAGLGSMLIETCRRFCEKEAVDAVILWPTPRSRRLYERYGFAVREDRLERRLH